MAKERFSRPQNDALRDASSLEEKIALLVEWKKNKEISSTLFNETTNNLINKEMRKVKPTFVNYTRQSICKTVVEGEIQTFIDKLRGQIKKYISHRDRLSVKLSKEDLEKLENYITQYGYHLQNKINTLLIVGLRYPDHGANKICSDYVVKHKIFPKQAWVDSVFWYTLWRDEDFVPLDAIRLMLQDNGKGEFQINPSFSKHILKDLRPWVEYQKKKEEIRLSLSQKLCDPDDIKRKQDRLDFFLCLIEVMDK